MITLDQIKGNLQKSVYDYLINFCPEDQKNINDEEAENALIYGIECYRIKFNKFYKCEICISYIDDNVLDFYNLSNKQEYLYYHINYIFLINY